MSQVVECKTWRKKVKGPSPGTLPLQRARESPLVVLFTQQFFCLLCVCARACLPACLPACSQLSDLGNFHKDRSVQKHKSMHVSGADFDNFSHTHTQKGGHLGRRQCLCSSAGPGSPPVVVRVTETAAEWKRCPSSSTRTNLLVKRLSLNRSQCGGCSTKYDTPTESQVVYG